MLITEAHVAWAQSQFQGATFVPGKLDIQDQPIYDTVTLAVGGIVNANNVSFFTSVRSSTGKTLADTNLTRDSELPDPEMFACKALSLHFDENISATDLQNIMKSFALQLIVGTKPLLTLPLWRIGAAGGIHAVTTATNQTFLQNGVPTRENLHTLALPIVIPPGVNFSANFVGGSYTLAGANGMRATLALGGLYAKGVQ
jgi:hypothetical protein